MTYGLVFGPHEIREYSNEVVSHGFHHVDDARLRLVSMTRARYRATEVIQAFAGFASLDGQSFFECHVGNQVSTVLDGTQFDIEGRVNGKYFAFRISAPRDCAEPRIHALWQAIAFARTSLDRGHKRVGRSS